MRFRLLLLRFLTLFALAICSGQFADQLTHAGAFCEEGGSCEQVTNSKYGKPLGIPLPVFGLIGFGLLFAFTLVPKCWAVRLVRILGVIGGLVGISLLFIQFAVLKQVCTLCVLVDFTAIAIGAIASIGLPEPAVISRFRLLAWILAVPLPVLIPIGWTAAMLPDSAPEEIQKHWVPGEVNIVEMSDFECPHCQKADRVLQEVLKHHKVHLVRLVAPVNSHVNAKTAARAYIAARKLGKGEEMAKELYSAVDPTPETCRSAERCREMAARIGVNLKDYDYELRNEATEFEINRTLELVKIIKQGVPCMWVQHQFLKGVPTLNDLDEAIKKAELYLK
ncbi:MAG TPA: vitamin K epoxide reductase family protein [Gemmata sp.]|jgi:uncharacterized membrane protein/glutaredoxin|nr:vitamin K epoxide reductase family protein [Gemmata sp.]